MRRNNVPPNSHTLNAIILSAGLGTRLYPRTKYLPKCLISIKSKSLLEIQSEYFRKIGVKNTFVTIGSKGPCWTRSNILQIKSIEENIIMNPINDKTGNAYSFFLSKDLVDSNADLIITDGDVFFTLTVLSSLLSLRSSSLVVRPAHNTDELGGRVFVKNEIVKRCGRNLEPISLPFYIFSGLMFVKANIAGMMYDIASEEPGDVLDIINALCQKYIFKILISSQWENINDEHSLSRALSYNHMEKL